MRTLLRPLAFLLLSAFLPSLAAAQSTSTPGSSLSIGVKGGLALGTIETDDELNLEHRRGITAGLSLMKDLSSSVGLGAEVLWTQRGTREVGTGVTMELDYLDVPVLVRVGSSSGNGTRFHVFTGPQAGLRLRARLEGGPTARDLKNEIHPFELAWTAGAGVEVRGVTLDARYTLGLTNVDDSSAFDEFTNRTISVMIGYRLR